MSDWNDKIIEEFRANGGKVGGQFDGAPILLLHTTGAKTGQQRVHPMMYRPVDGGYAVFASKAGAPTKPRLVSQPGREPERAGRDRHADSRDCAPGSPTTPSASRSGPRRRPDYPGFQEYEDKTTRQIPVVILEPAS